MSDKRNILHEISSEFVNSIQKRDIPQSEIARITDKNKGTVSRIFKGDYSFSLDDIKLISNQLNIPAISIFTRHMCGNLSPEVKKLLETLESAENTFCENLAELQAIKKAKDKKAAS